MNKTTRLGGAVMGALAAAAFVFAPAFGPARAADNSVSVAAGDSALVSLPSGSYGTWSVTSNTNPQAISAIAAAMNIRIQGLAAGTGSVTACSSYGQQQCQTISVTVTGGVLGESRYHSGALISENGTVYIVYKNTKIGFTSFASFTVFGFRFANVVPVTDSGLAVSDTVVDLSKTTHPWGSWINDNGTIYFVHENGLIPIPTYDTFLNNGGDINLVVPANTDDLALPVLDPMTLDDARLQ
jgi:hypothetical protein